MARCRIVLLAGLALGLTGCGIFEHAGESMPSEVIVVERKGVDETETQEVPERNQEETESMTPEIAMDVSEPEIIREPVKVKGIYISAYTAGTPQRMEELFAAMDQSEVNTLVIDLKDDFGRVVCDMDSGLIQEIGSVKTYIPDMQELMKHIDAHEIYAIARIPAFRDAWLGEVRPEWCVHNADGSLYRDRDGNTWVNPYRREAWDYLVEIASQAGKLGFDEVQFDYVRFCTEKGMKDVVFEETDMQGRSRTDIIEEFIAYACDRLKREGLFVSADVFGAIIGSEVDADAVGQIYGEMAKHLDYISPMIYPSHYADGNYGIDHPDLHPYETVQAALADSRKELSLVAGAGDPVAQVRPWLQDFTATWLSHHMEYGPEQIRQQIQAVYDSGYEEWILWDASGRYCWEGLGKPEETELKETESEEGRN